MSYFENIAKPIRYDIEVIFVNIRDQQHTVFTDPERLISLKFFNLSSAAPGNDEITIWINGINTQLAYGPGDYFSSLLTDSTIPSGTVDTNVYEFRWDSPSTAAAVLVIMQKYCFAQKHIIEPKPPLI